MEFWAKVNRMPRWVVVKFQSAKSLNIPAGFLAAVRVQGRATDGIASHSTIFRRRALGTRQASYYTPTNFF